MPAARLAIVGDGPLRPTLEQTFAGLPVCFTGYLTGGDLAAAYAAADVFVFPAHNETFGNVVAEAMASGLPVVAARSGGVEEQIVPGVTGLLAAAGSQAHFIDCAASLVRDPAWARQLGAHGRAHAEARSWGTVLDGLLDMYAMLTKKPAGMAKERVRSTGRNVQTERNAQCIR